MGILRRLFGRKYTPSWDGLDPAAAKTEATSSADSVIYTGTATIVIYDLESLRHRLDDYVDWWASTEDEILELNERNLLIVGLGSDGFYDVDVSDDQRGKNAFSLRFPSGRVFIGAGEMLTGGGDEPDADTPGIFLDLAPGDYKVGIERSDEQLRVSIVRSAPFDNAVVEPVTLF